MASLTEQIPAVVDSVEIFCEKLKKHAKKGDIVELDEMVIRLTFDVIMKISLYVPLSLRIAYAHIFQRHGHQLPTNPPHPRPRLRQNPNLALLLGPPRPPQPPPPLNSNPLQPPHQPRSRQRTRKALRRTKTRSREPHLHSRQEAEISHRSRAPILHPRPTQKLKTRKFLRKGEYWGSSGFSETRSVVYVHSDKSTPPLPLRRQRLHLQHPNLHPAPPSKTHPYPL